MCLILNKNARIQTAKQDIIVWKHIEQKLEGNYVTSYQQTRVSFNTIMKSPIEKGVISGWHSSPIGTPCVDRALHSYVNKKSAERNICYSEVVVKCIIPKGSKYYIGTFHGKASYASNQLIYKEIVKKYKLKL